jgi:hypothetical protein
VNTNDPSSFKYLFDKNWTVHRTIERRTSKTIRSIWGSHGGEYEDGSFGLQRRVVWLKFTDVSEVLDGGSKYLWNVGELLPDYTNFNS